MNDPGFAKSGRKRVTSFRYVQMMPSPRVGSGVDVRQISTFWNVKIPRRSNWVLHPLG